MVLATYHILPPPPPLFDTWDPDTRTAPRNTTVRRCSSDEEEDVELPDSQNMLVESDDGHITMPMSLTMGTSTPMHPAHSSPNLSDGVHLPLGIPKTVTVRRKKNQNFYTKCQLSPIFCTNYWWKHAGVFFFQIIPVKKEKQEKAIVYGYQTTSGLVFWLRFPVDEMKMCTYVKYLVKGKLNMSMLIVWKWYVQIL